MDRITTNLKSWLAGIVNRKMTQTRKDQLLVWAKTEYPKDWQYAYNHMLNNDGHPPRWMR